MSTCRGGHGAIFCAVLGLTLAGAASPASAEEPLNLLFFGNSFFQINNVPTLVKNLATADGRATPLVIGDLEGGKNLAFHLGEVIARPNNNVNHPLSAGKTWDIVVMQGHSSEATHVGDPGGFRTNALGLYEAILNHGSGRGEGVRGVLFETWARGPGHAVYNPNSPSYAFTSPAAMQSEVRTNYEAALADLLSTHGSDAARLARAGDAFEAMGFTRSLYEADIYHAGPQGSLLAALMLYRTIYDGDVSDIGYSSVSGWANVSLSTWTTLTGVADSIAIPEPTSLMLLMAASLCVYAKKRRLGTFNRKQEAR